MFNEADKVAMDYYRAYFENDFPEMYKMLSPKGQDSFLNENGYLEDIIDESNTSMGIEEFVNPEKFKEFREEHKDLEVEFGTGEEIEKVFKDFNKLKEEYEIRRYDEYFDKEKGELTYYITPVSDYDGYTAFGDSAFIVMKQNPEGEWKLKNIGTTIFGINV
ncbi:hypothetical protein [Virgibacillus alimentarius]|uniref:hypothetical protein n=1 Tax=Virgibacillus alimentarius TaxID=698769 RepID=UPI000493A83A|nr:hypothetical protein [Virgibacillus alimentarius]